MIESKMTTHQLDDREDSDGNVSRGPVSKFLSYVDRYCWFVLFHAVFGFVCYMAMTVVFALFYIESFSMWREAVATLILSAFPIVFFYIVARALIYSPLCRLGAWMRLEEQ